MFYPLASPLISRIKLISILLFLPGNYNTASAYLLWNSHCLPKGTVSPWGKDAVIQISMEKYYCYLPEMLQHWVKSASGTGIKISALYNIAELDIFSDTFSAIFLHWKFSIFFLLPCFHHGILKCFTVKNWNWTLVTLWYWGRCEDLSLIYTDLISLQYYFCFYLPSKCIPSHLWNLSPTDISNSNAVPHDILASFSLFGFIHFSIKKSTF